MGRIRTIKPEFWQNETLSKLSLHARLLAIALLNHADDEGYFQASAALVRASCFPFDDDSSNVRRSLDELSCAGYIEVKNCGEKEVGKVVKFCAHQRIDRPQKSKLKAIFIGESTDSTNARRALDERSTNVRCWNREQGTGKGMEQGVEAETLSHHMMDKGFAKQWQKWTSHLAAEGKPLNAISEEEQLLRLAGFSVEEAIEIVKFSIHRQAKGLILNGDHKAKSREDAFAW